MTHFGEISKQGTNVLQTVRAMQAGATLTATAGYYYMRFEDVVTARPAADQQERTDLNNIIKMRARDAAKYLNGSGDWRRALESLRQADKCDSKLKATGYWITEAGRDALKAFVEQVEQAK